VLFPYPLLGGMKKMSVTRAGGDTRSHRCEAASCDGVVRCGTRRAHGQGHLHFFHYAPNYWTALHHAVYIWISDWAGTVNMDSSTSPLRDRDLVARRRMPIYEQVLDVLGDVLFDTDELLDLLRSERTPPEYEWLRPEVQEIYEQVNSVMKKICD